MTTNRTVLAAAAVVMLLGQTACSNMTEQERKTAIGAGVGAIGGSVVTDGSTAGAIGGAAVGGLIGHELGKPNK